METEKLDLHSTAYPPCRVLHDNQPNLTPHSSSHHSPSISNIKKHSLFPYTETKQKQKHREYYEFNLVNQGIYTSMLVVLGSYGLLTRLKTAMLIFIQSSFTFSLFIACMFSISEIKYLTDKVSEQMMPLTPAIRFRDYKLNNFRLFTGTTK